MPCDRASNSTPREVGQNQIDATRPPDFPADRRPAKPGQAMPQYNPPPNWPAPPPGWTPPGTADADRLVTAAVAEVLSLLLELDLDPALPRGRWKPCAGAQRSDSTAQQSRPGEVGCR